MSRVLVTGANGFLAGNTISELLQRGYRVRGMLRKTARLMIDHPGLEPFYGNITDKNDVDEAVKECESVIHIAALTDQSVAGYRLYERVNIGGTVNIIKASLQQKIKKVIYVGTANAFGYGTGERPGDETLPMKYPFTGSGYAVSKAEAQNIALKELGGTGTGITIVNPTFMIGPNDHNVSSNRIILRALGKKILLIPPGGKNFIHVMDAAKGICNALEYGASGECFILAGENLTYREFYVKLAGITRCNPLLVTVPGYLLLLAGIAGNILRHAGINTSISLTNMKILTICNFYSADKAVKKINMPQTPVEKAIEETVSWFEDNKVPE